VGLAKEATFGTPVAATTFLPMTGCTIEEDPGWFSPELMMDTRDLHVFNLYGEAKFTGAIDGPLFPSNAIELLVAAVGTDAVTGTAPPYTHTISQANTLPSLTVEKNTGDFESLQFAGCRLGKFSLKVPTGNEAAMITADVSGQSVLTLSSPTAVTVTNELPFVFAEATASIFGTARTEAHNVEFSIDNGLKETYTYSQAHGPSFITPVTLHVSGSLDVVWDSFTDSTYGDFTKMVNGTEGAFSIALAHPSNAGSVTLNAPQVVYSKFSNDLKMTDVVLASMTWEATKQLTDGYTVQAVVLNSVSTAY
jgi:Phage tail tube protein